MPRGGDCSAADNQTNCALGDTRNKLGTYQLHIITVILRMRHTQLT